MKTLLIISVLFIAFPAESQIKFGDIEVSEKIAGQYLADCYAHPDSFRIYSNSWYGEEEAEKIKKAIRSRRFDCDYEENCRRYKMSYQYDSVTVCSIDKKDPNCEEYIYYYIPREPSAHDFARWYRERTRK